MTDFRTLLKRQSDGGSYPTNERIELGRYALSIQCSTDHYCEPRMTLNDPGAYTHFEVAVFRDGEWVLFAPGDELTDERWTQYADCDYFEGMENNVLAYVPEDVVQALFDRIEQLNRELLR